MIGRFFAKQLPGAVISARTINAPTEEMERQSRLRLGAGLAGMSGPGNDVIRPIDVERQDARITGNVTGNKYSWQGIYDAPGGGWNDAFGTDDRGGADPAYEANGNVSVPVGTRVELVREPFTGEWRFQAGYCIQDPQDGGTSPTSPTAAVQSLGAYDAGDSGAGSAASWTFTNASTSTSVTLTPSSPFLL